MAQVTLNTRIEYEVAQKLNEYAKETGESKASITEKAISEYLKKNEIPQKSRR